MNQQRATADEYLGQDAVQVGVTPSRVAYLFPAGNAREFRRAVVEASSRWAGATEPIIPVRRGGRVDAGWQQFVDLSEVVACVNVGCAAGDAQTASRHLGLTVTDVQHAGHGESGWTLHWSVLASGGPTPVRASDNCALWELVAAGFPDPPDDGESLVTPRHWATDDHAGRSQFSGTTVLDLGLGGFAEYFAANHVPAPALIWLTRPNSLPDCVWFWNLRAVRSLGIYRAPMAILPLHADAWIDLPQMLASSLYRAYTGNPDVVMSSRTVSTQEMSAFALKMGLRPSTGPVSFSGPLFQGEPSPGPYTFGMNIDARNWLMFKRKAGYVETVRVQQFRSRTTVSTGIADLPARLGRAAGAPLRVRLDGGFIANFPRRAEVAKLIHRNAVWCDESLEIIASIFHGSEVDLVTPRPEEIVQAILRGAVADASLSDKGKVGHALRAGRDCSVLLEPEMLTVLSNMRTPRSKELARELRRAASTGAEDQSLLSLAMEWGGRANRVYRSVETVGVGVRRAKALLESLANAGWAERGVETICATCGVATFVEFAYLTGEARCPGCGAKGDLSGGKGVTVWYRLNSLVDRACDQGVVTHLAVDHALRMVDSNSHLWLGTNLTMNEGDAVEVDLFGSGTGRVLLGEVKTAAAEFSTTQVDRDVELARRVQADVYVLGCAEVLLDAQLEYARQVCAKAGVDFVHVMPGATGALSVST